MALIVGLTAFFTLRLAKARDRADREAAITTAMKQFISDDLLGQSDPFRSGQIKESFADVVNRASSHIDIQFKGQPVLAARLGKAFDNRFEFPQARREYARAKDLFRQSEGPLSEDAIVASLQRAAMEARSQEGGSLLLPKSLVADSENSIAKIARPRDDLAVWLFIARGAIAIVGNDTHTALANYSDALHRAEAGSALDEAARTRIRRTLAFAYIRLGDGAKAEPLLRDVVEYGSRINGPDSPVSLQARVTLAQAFLVQDKYAEAVREANALYPVLAKTFGEDHEIPMSVLGTRAAAEGSMGMWDEAIRDDLAVYNLSVRKQGPISFFSLGMLSDVALSQCRAGRYAEGEPNARKTFTASRDAFGARAGITGGTACPLAICLIGMNKLQEASELLENINARAVVELSGDPSVGASITLAKGEVAAHTLAKRYADAAAPTFEAPGAAVGEKHALQQLRNAIRSRSNSKQ